ncbi:MAG: DUF6265 family protein [Candidatus Acidiferrales bacterium]
MRRMAVVLCGIVLIVAAEAGSGARQGGAGANTVSGKIADFAWLTGWWTGTVGEATAEEICSEASHHVMSCMIRYMDAENVTQLEFVSLREMPLATGGPPMPRRGVDDTGNASRGRVLTTVEEKARLYPTDLREKAGDEGITLRLASVSGTEIVFDNARTDEAIKHLRYIRNGADEFTSHLDLVGADGKPAVMEAKWRRAR